MKAWALDMVGAISPTQRAPPIHAPDVTASTVLLILYLSYRLMAMIGQSLIKNLPAELALKVEKMSELLTPD